MGAESSAAHGRLGNSPQHVALLGPPADDQVGVDCHRPLAVTVGRQAHGAVSQGENRTTVSQIQKIEVMSADRHLQNYSIVRRLDKTHVEMRRVFVSCQEPLDAFHTHAGDATADGR